MRWLLLLGLTGCVRTLPPTMLPTAVEPVHTVDGWTLPMRHYAAEGPPVLLVHGMSASHHNWDYREEVSLAHYLHERGFDVWIPSMRGDPLTVAPSRLAARSFDVDDFATLDLPAAVDAVLARTGAADLLWVGHSMGGMLLYTTLDRRPHLVRAGVAICSPAHFEADVGAEALVHIGAALMRGERRIPSRGIGRLTVGLGKLNPMVPRVGNVSNLDRAVVNGMARHALVDLSYAMARQVSTWLRAGQLVDSWGEPYDLGAEVPLLLMAGAQDRLVAAEDVRRTCAEYPRCRFELLGQAAGYSVDYGHVDPVVGISAPAEVYPVVEAFLREHPPRPVPSEGARR